jgi:transposase InsO family protein
LILKAHKTEVMMLLEEAHQNRARYSKACEVVGISNRTLQRWKCGDLLDRLKGSKKIVVRKVSQQTRAEIINFCNEPLFRDQTPYEIVPQLLEEGRYLASESTFYRILREADQMHHRSQMRVRHRHGKPPEGKATGSDQVYTWAITYMNQTIRGLFYYAYVVKDIYDRSIVGWAVHEEESETHNGYCLIGS